MFAWDSRVVRWTVLLVVYAALAGLVYFFGRHGVPLVEGMDRAISAFMNPDAYTPVLDEFFRAYTDYTILLLAVPLISLAVAYGIYRLAELPRAEAVRMGVVSCLLWWGALVLMLFLLELPLVAVLVFGAVAPGLILLGAVPPRVYPGLGAKRWLTALLWVEAILFMAAWISGKVWWNQGLPGANFFLLGALVVMLGGTAYGFYRMSDEGLSRYTRVFWLILLCIVLVEFIGTDNIKSSIARPRPLAESNASWNAVLRAIPEETLRGSNSFPSGHTSATFALITPLFWWTRRRGVRAGLLSVGVVQAVSRVYTVAHFASDVIMGGILGFGTGTLIFFLLGGSHLRAPEELGQGEE